MNRLPRRRRSRRPGLITARGLELIRGCEALVYDVLVAPELVAEAPEEAIFVSRERIKQGELNELLVDLGRQGLEVVRLKGGDPFVFRPRRRGGDRARRGRHPLRGDPRRVRDLGRARVGRHPRDAPRRLGAGHARQRPLRLRRRPRLRAPGAHARHARRFHGPRTLSGIAARLVEHGKSPDTPAAIVSRGTQPDSRSVTGRLDEIARLAEGLDSPALLVVGDVVAVAEEPGPARPSSAPSPPRGYETMWPGASGSHRRKPPTNALPLAPSRT